MTMPRKDLTRLIKQFHGWWDGDTARFPSPHLKDQFLGALEALQGQRQATAGDRQINNYVSSAR